MESSIDSYFYVGVTFMEATILEPGTATPCVRFRLKARIFEVGYRTFRDFATKVGMHPVMLSKVLNGHLFPGPSLQRRIAEELGLTLRELRELL